MVKYLFILLILVFANFSYAQNNKVKAYFTLNPIGDFIGTMKVTSGYATSKDGKYHAKNIVVDLNSLETGMSLRNDHAKDKYLEISKYPKAILLEGVGASGIGKARISLHGKENVVSGTYKIVNSGKSLSAEFKISLASFGIAAVSFKGVGVEDDVRVEVVVPIVIEDGKALPETKAKPAVKPATKSIVKPKT